MIYAESGLNPARNLSAYRAFHTVAWFAWAVTMALVALGGVVHNTGSSLACPDWPLCFGQVMPKMEGAVAIEHSHRLLGAAVGLLSIVLVALSRGFRGLRPDLYKASFWSLGLVIFQGVLGGATVLMGLSPLMSTLHLGTSQTFLGLLLWLALKSRPNHGAPATESTDARLLRPLTWVAAGVFFQILLGAAIRHGGAGSICGLGWASSLICHDQGVGVEEASLWPSSLPARFHMLHRYMGIVTIALVAWGALRVWRTESGPRLRCLATVALLLVLLQAVIGVFSIATYIGVTATTLHLVGAAALWMTILGMNFWARETT